MTAISDRRFCVAPMLDKTDRHFRYIARLLSKRAWLYTEMITTGAILRGDRDYQLRYHDAEHPLALQLGGSDPDEMRECALIAAAYGYDEININVGCPSDRVQEGMFGACLMAKPEIVAECLSSMREAVSIPVTVKHRIGIDDRDSYRELADFVRTVAGAGCETFIIHARKAWLQGLSPRENREIPPLDYQAVYRLKRDFPDLGIIINGGITSIEQSIDHLSQIDGVMVGRAAYDNLYLLSEVDEALYAAQSPRLTRKSMLRQLLPYFGDELSRGTQTHHITRHLMGLFQGVPGARDWRRMLSSKPDIESFRQLVDELPDESDG